MDKSSTDKIKVCPQCSASFSCSPSDCWCAALPPVMPMVEGAECYCPKCLARMVQKLSGDRDNG